MNEAERGAKTEAARKLQLRLCEIEFDRPGWEKYPKLRQIFEHRPSVNVYWHELVDLIREQLPAVPETCVYTCSFCGRRAESKPVHPSPALGVYGLPDGWRLVDKAWFAESKVQCKECDVRRFGVGVIEFEPFKVTIKVAPDVEEAWTIKLDKAVHDAVPDTALGFVAIDECGHVKILGTSRELDRFAWFVELYVEKGSDVQKLVRLVDEALRPSGFRVVS